MEFNFNKAFSRLSDEPVDPNNPDQQGLSLIHISEPTRR